ncbi:MAG: glycosyltransferase family 2 protein [Desulfovermiculus sp.]|nr:glycosyltransferase family 2 protein [Desulfovermiculus sp.]
MTDSGCEQGISVVIPVYNSQDCLHELSRQLLSFLGDLTDRLEIIFVDDCSPDRSWEVITELAEQDRRVRALQLSKNEGQAMATLCGLEQVQFETVVTMDDDLQHRPDQLAELIRTLWEHPELDCVFGVFTQKFHSRYRNLGSRIIQKLNVLAFDMPPDIRSSGFRVMRRNLVRCITLQKSANPVIAVLIFRCTTRVCSVPVLHAERYAGNSNYSMAKQFRLALDNICHVTFFPLRIVSFLGVTGCILSTLLGATYFSQYLAGQIHEPGWITIILLLTFFSGLILLSIGILGEYMVRIAREVSPKKSYIIRQQLNSRYEQEVGYKP